VSRQPWKDRRTTVSARPAPRRPHASPSPREPLPENPLRPSSGTAPRARAPQGIQGPHRPALLLRLRYGSGTAHPRACVVVQTRRRPARGPSVPPSPPSPDPAAATDPAARTRTVRLPHPSKQEK